MENSKTTAVVLAAGQGKRMQSSIHKQYLQLQGKPILYYALNTFEQSFIDAIVLVVGKGEETYCRQEVLEKYGITKVKAIVEGGRERYHSVANGLRAVTWQCDYIFIHDGARPFISTEILLRTLETVKSVKACVVGMPVKDTIKVVDENGYVASTLARSHVWQIQTPQAFDKTLITSSYETLLKQEANLLAQGVQITDDAMVAEYFSDISIKLVEGSYQNIKITTPEDLKIAQILLEK